MVMADVVFLTDPAKEQMEIMLNDIKNAVRLALKVVVQDPKYDWTLEDPEQETNRFTQRKIAIDSMRMYLI